MIFVLSDKNKVIDIAKNIVDDLALRVDDDYNITRFKPNLQIVTELLNNMF